MKLFEQKSKTANLILIMEAADAFVQMMVVVAAAVALMVVVGQLVLWALIDCCFVLEVADFVHIVVVVIVCAGPSSFGPCDICSSNTKCRRSKSQLRI